MRILSLAPAYFKWHYTSAFRSILFIWMDLLWFVYNFFSVPMILRTFFSPWKRLGEEPRSGFHPQEFFEALVVNTMMRIVGVIIRTFFLTFAIMALVVTLLGGMATLILWPVLPFAAIGFILVGVGVLFQ